MAVSTYKNEQKGPRLTAGEFIVLFVTFLLLAFFSIERFGHALKRSARKQAEISVAEIVSREHRFFETHARYGSLDEINFNNPFSDNSVVFVLSIEDDFVIQAKENIQFDAFGDNTPGNEYFIGYPNGTVEYVH
ncbi:MAG: hypothetical protein A2293_12050 [Elusimicrobia bacterium RIFOXYB2_FULL_49_7]|nr:MAG: hypothetical protein A2293_12050 [Elusimicrobia bacterium RIFOXYB2_FULL_49_7]